VSIIVILAMGILACDVAIYLLYEWAFGESERIRKKSAVVRKQLQSPAVGHPGAPVLMR
jgi:hypothetical protein